MTRPCPHCGEPLMQGETGAECPLRVDCRRCGQAVDVPDDVSATEAARQGYDLCKQCEREGGR